MISDLKALRKNLRCSKTSREHYPKNALKEGIKKPGLKVGRAS